MSRRPDAPSPAVAIAGGVGVLAVVAFVVAVGLGGSTERVPGEKVRLAAGDGDEELVVLAGRCLDERVLAVRVTEPGGGPLWAVASEKGSIERRFVVGGEPPLGFEEVRSLRADLPATVTAEVSFARDGDVEVDARTVEVAGVEPQGDVLADGAPACGGDEGPGTVTILFAVAALVVVAGYAVMLARLRRR